MASQIMVVGPHRSGTSLMAGILHHLGVPMGPMAPKEFSHPESNPLGQYEDDRFVRLFDHMIGNWRDPEPWYILTEHGQEAAKRAIALIREQDEKYDVWGLKSPQLCYTMRFIIRYLSDPYVIFCGRDFDAAVQSLMKRDEFPRQVAEHIISRCTVALLHTRGVVQDQGGAGAVIFYEQVLEHPKEVVTALTNFLPIEPTELQVQRAIAHVRPDLRHF